MVIDGPAVVIGAGGGIGAASVAALAARPGRHGSVVALSRQPVPAAACVIPGRIDVTDEASIAAAARMTAEHGSPGLVIVATGTLHAPGGMQPEKSWRSLDADTLLHAYRVNAVGPALVAKHFLPLLPRQGRSVFAALSARVGSIGDNRLGGWHAYRASKAALNMLLRNLAVELARSRPEAICVGLHPGTVDTALSRPFQGNVPEGGLFTPDEAVEKLLHVLAGLTPAESGGVFDWTGRPVTP